jgi:hypothetical protein
LTLDRHIQLGLRHIDPYVHIGHDSNASARRRVSPRPGLARFGVHPQATVRVQSD